MLATFTGLSASLQAETIFNDINGSAASGFIVFIDTAAPFTTPTAVSLSNVSVFVDATFPAITTFSAEILSDAAGVPGSVLAKVSDIPAPSQPRTVSIDFSPDALHLSSGTTYWLVLQPLTPGNNPIIWFYNPQFNGLPLGWGLPLGVFPNQGLRILKNGL